MRIHRWLTALAFGALAYKEEALPDMYEAPRSYVLPLPPSTVTHVALSTNTILQR